MFSPLNSILGWLSNDLAIDLGTANTLVYMKGKGIVLREPSVVAIRKDGRANKVLAVGKEAKMMVGRTLLVLASLRMATTDGSRRTMPLPFMYTRVFAVPSNRRTLVHPRIIISVPSGITQVEKRAVKESAESAGAREIYLIEEPMAAAIGAVLPITEPTANMIVDIGGGTTEVAVISLSGIVYSKSVRVAGDKMDEAIIQHLKRKYNLLIGERTAELIKISIGSATPASDEESMLVKGRDLVAGIPKTIEILISSAVRSPIRRSDFRFKC